MGELFDRYDGEVMRGKEITISDCFLNVFISQSDEVFCYSGICLDKTDNRSLFMNPYYMAGKHSTDKEISNKITGFYRIVNGYISLDNYVDYGTYSNHFYKRIDCAIRFPHPDNYYAVFVDNQEDEDLTRAIFGLTHEEITSLLDAYAITMGTYHEYSVYPKLTKSQRSSHSCDITDFWIPERFPYVAFKDSGYDFSHVSLFGFYRHIQLLTGYKTNSVFSKALIKSGVSDKILERVFNLNIYNLYCAKVIKDTRDYY